MMPFSADPIFFFVSAIVQALIGVGILIRRPGRDWGIFLAALFIFNGIDAFLRGLSFFEFTRGGGVYNFQSSISTTLSAFDVLTTYLVLALALVFPNRPRFLKKNWQLGLLILPPLLVSIWGALSGRYDLFFSYPSSGASYHFAIFDYVGGSALRHTFFVILVFRWSQAFLKTQNFEALAPLALMLAAFGMRAMHVVTRFGISPVVQPNVNRAQLIADNPILLPLHFTWFIFWVIVLYVIVARFIFLAMRAPPAKRRWGIMVSIFFLLGALEGFVVLAAPSNKLYYVNYFSHIDTLIVRPILVWFAINYLDYLGAQSTHLRRFGIGVVGLLTFVGFYATFDAGPGTDEINEIAGILMKGILAIIATLLMLYLLIQTVPHLEGGVKKPAGVQAFIIALEDAYARGSGKLDSATVENHRLEFGLSHGQADALAEATAAGWATSAGIRSFLPGEVLRGRYEVKGIIGEGGGGEVYLATDRVGDREVVLKRGRNFNAKDLRQIVKEAQFLSSLSSPHLVKFLGLERNGPEMVLVMEYIDGGSGSQLLARGAQKPDLVRKIARDILNALSLAHSKGIIHRDIKPSNILIRKSGEAVLADFGVAATRGELDLGGVTQEITHPGTVAYSSPEQIQGMTGDARSDLFAVGVLLFELLEGSHPFKRRGTAYEVQNAILHDAPRPFAKSKDSKLNQWVLSLLQKKPSDRPASAGSALLQLGD